MEALIAELQALVADPPDLERFVRAVPALPLFHRLGEPLREGLMLEIARPKARRAELGTDECLFASVGTAAYLTPPLLLAFGPMDDAHARAGRRTAPWDTAELHRVLGISAEVAASHIERYSVDAADDELYVAHLLARYFPSFDGWCRGEPATGADVLGVIAALTRSPGPEVDDDRFVRMTTPEARFSVGLDLREGLLLAAFADVEAAAFGPRASEWAETFRQLEATLGDGFIRVRRTLGAADLRGAARTFVRRLLEVEGLQ